MYCTLHFQLQEDEVRKLYRNFARDSMLGYNTSMKVVEESLYVESVVTDIYGNSTPPFDLYSFWIIIPKGKCDKYTCNCNAFYEYDTLF